MKYISWNEKGIRAVLKKGFQNFVKSENPDILCIQETKANQEQVDLDLAEYRQYWNSTKKPGYAGTIILTKIEPENVFYGMDIAELDNEGRLITVEFLEYYLVNVYTPDAQRGLVYNQFDLINTLKTKQIWVAGLDLTNPAPMEPGNPLLSQWRMLLFYLILDPVR